MKTNALTGFAGFLSLLFSALLFSACGEEQKPREARISLISKVENGQEVGLPDLEPTITPKEVTTKVEKFTWSTTKPLAEVTKDGDPTLYYARIYVKSHEERRFLDHLRLHHSTLPLLSHERAHYQGKVGKVRPPSDGKGVLISAIIPGKVYNVIRKYALKGDALFDTIELVDDVPLICSRLPFGRGGRHRGTSRRGIRFSVAVSIMIRTLWTSRHYER
jgi:hypothetical protein